VNTTERFSVLGLALALASCAPRAEPCASAGTCPVGQECLANRCVVAGGEPVAPDTQRITLEPVEMAVVSAKTAPRARTLPGVVTFGSDADGATALYLEFPDSWRRARRIEAAFLVLEPMPGTAPAASDVDVELWRVRGHWTEKRLSWLDQPERVPPQSAGIARSTPPSPLRIDVTELCRFLHAHREAEVSFAIESGDGAGSGASFATGASGGRAPRLEVYVR
jgi:hypothetical protein